MNGEYAVLNVKFAPVYLDMIEYDVELQEISISDGYGKDVTVNWVF